MMEAPVVREDESSGLLVIDWPRHRDAELVLASELFEAMVVMINIERQRAHDIAVLGRRVCERWNDDDVDAGAMDREMGQLRQAIDGET